MGTADRSDTLSELVTKFVEEGDLVGSLVWLADRCVGLPDVTASGLMVVDAEGALDVIAASSRPARLLQELEKKRFEGPARDGFHGGRRIDCADLAEADIRWPHYAPVARRFGMAAIHALPMRLVDRTGGVLTLFATSPGSLPDDVLEFGQSLAYAAALGVGNHRARQSEILAAQLQTALHSRVVIEQAKGVLAERATISVDEAFAALRQHARNTGRKLGEVASSVLDGRLDVPAIQRP